MNNDILQPMGRRDFLKVGSITALLLLLEVSCSPFETETENAVNSLNELIKDGNKYDFIQDIPESIRKEIFNHIFLLTND